MKALIKPVILLLLLSNPLFSQVFITVDADTQEFVESVDYSMFKYKKAIYKGITFNDRVTKIDEKVDYDSISFSRVDYKTLGLPKSRIDSVIRLTKNIIYLDEVVIGSNKKNEVTLGENNRFVKRMSRALCKDLDYGLIILNGSPQKLQLDKIAFYIDKVKLKTAYRINFSEVNEIYVNEAYRLAEPGELLYTTDTLYLNPKDKNRMEVMLPPDCYLPSARKMFVWIQLLGYYDATGKEVIPETDQQTKLKFQMSEKTNYYSRRFDRNTQKTTREIFNINQTISYDLAKMYFITPHKSDLVAPAILLYAHKVEGQP